jgi:LacI family transcriptional regulator
MKLPTMRDVAKLAGVSKTTVSHVVNETRFVEEETKRRVLQAIEELGYYPNVAARSLTTKRTGTIGIVISDASNLFFGEVLLGIEDILQPENYGLIVCNTDEILEREAHYLDLLLSQRVEGIIAAATSQRWAALAQAEIQHTPIVSVDRTFPGSEVPFVGVDNKHGAYLGTKHLIECGHRKLGVIAGFPRLSTMRERIAGFCQALEEDHIPVPEEWIVYSPLKAGEDAALQVLSLPERPTALFVNNNQLAIGVLLAIKRLGLRCPEDIALVVFDDHPWAAVSDPPLTVVRQPTRELGQISARMLLDLIKGRELTEKNAILECELVIRQSSGPFGDGLLRK